jgi:AbrB family looped-hinge helix DNA binding protein|tara:strand:+ start:7173 stop:7409 length:237 start_codon:yes stop_codon:yes gene_type:complete
MIKTIKVSDKGQIAIPQSVRESLQINKGDELVLIEDGGKILLEKANEVIEKLGTAIASESSLAKTWLNEEEDELWKDL